MTTLHDKIQAKTQAFAGEIAELVQSSLLEIFGRKPQRKVAAPATKALRPGEKRSAAAIARTVDALLMCIKANPGQSIEQLGRIMGVTTRELTLPAKKLLASKRVRTTGQKRATRYYAR